MRILASVAALGLALVATAQTIETAAAGPYPVRHCARYTDGSENCGFFSRRQCLASVYGVGGFCTADTVQESVVIVPVQTRRGTVLIEREID
jgi:hypothetical protein